MCVCVCVSVLGRCLCRAATDKVAQHKRSLQKMEITVISRVVANCAAVHTTSISIPFYECTDKTWGESKCCVLWLLFYAGFWWLCRLLLCSSDHWRGTNCSAYFRLHRHYFEEGATFECRKTVVSSFSFSVIYSSCLGNVADSYVYLWQIWKYYLFAICAASSQRLHGHWCRWWVNDVRGQCSTVKVSRLPAISYVLLLNNWLVEWQEGLLACKKVFPKQFHKVYFVASSLPGLIL